MVEFIWVCLGSAVGGGARYLVSAGMLRVLGGGFPYGTFAVNFLGSFMLAALMLLGTEATVMSSTTRLALTTGVMGGFTTYSTFSYETLRYVHDGAWAGALVNIVITVVGCLIAAALGFALAKGMVRA